MYVVIFFILAADDSVHSAAAAAPLLSNPVMTNIIQPARNRTKQFFEIRSETNRKKEGKAFLIIKEQAREYKTSLA